MTKEEEESVQVLCNSPRSASRTALGVVLVIFGLLLVAAMGVFVYWFVVRDVDSLGQRQRIVGTATLNRPWDPQLADSSSTEFRELNNKICSGLANAIQQDTYECAVTSFEPGSIKAHFTIEVEVNHLVGLDTVVEGLQEGTFVDDDVAIVEIHTDTSTAGDDDNGDDSDVREGEDESDESHEDEPFEGVVGGNGAYRLNWTSNAETITVTILGRTRGWVGFGISGTGGMKKADIMMAWVDNNGTGHILDTYSDANGAPIIDTSSQDWQLLEASEDYEHTRVTARRFLRLCDTRNRNVTSGTLKVIWALGDRDPSSETSLGGDIYHGSRRGTVSKRLLVRAPPPPQLPEDALEMTFYVDEVAVSSSSDTTYWCTLIEQPILVDQYHYIASEAHIQVGHEQFVHHMVVYLCEGLPEVYHNMSADCLDHGFLSTVCDVVLAAWAVGSEPFHYPQHVGHPIGGTATGRFFLLEIHYDNPHMQAGIVDNSGLIVHITPTFRTYDASALVVAIPTHPIMMVPPKMDQFISTGHCTERCLNLGLRNMTEGIRVFGVLLHTHLAGIAVRLRHVRDGVELQPVVKDMTYDFNYQNAIMLDEEVTIMAGDRLLIDCYYNTTDREQVTYGGLSTHDEMCVSYLFYYPKMAVGLCTSLPTVEQMVSSIEGAQIYWDRDLRGYLFSAPDSLAGLPVMGFLDYGLRNDSRYREDLQSVVRDGRIYDFCEADNIKSLEIYSISGVEHPFVEPPEEACNSGIPDQ